MTTSTHRRSDHDLSRFDRSAREPGWGSDVPSRLDAAEYETLLAATAASERRAVDTAAKTAEALQSVVSWMTDAQQQFAQTTEASARLQEKAASTITGAVDALDRRLVEVERRSAAEPPGVSEAIDAIRRIEMRLAEPSPAAPSSLDALAFDQSLRSFEARMDALTQKIETQPKPLRRRELKPGQELRSAVAEIRSHQARLDGGPAAAPPRPAAATGLPALGTLARSQTAMLTSLRADVAKLASRIEEAPAPSAKPEQDTLHREVETLRASMAEIAKRDDLGRLERGLQELTTDIAELRSRGRDGAVAADMEQLQAEIRRLSQRREPVIDTAPLSRDIEKLSTKLDRVAASGVAPEMVGSLSGQVEEVRRLLTGAAAPQALALVDQHLAEIRMEIAAVSGRQVGLREFDALRATVEEVRASLKGIGPTPAVSPDLSDTMREFGGSIATMMSTLVEKVERVERRLGDATALDHLEQQVQTIAARIGATPERDPGVRALEHSMSDLLSQVSTWREGAIEAAEHAARMAVAETIESMPVAAEVERHLVEIGERYASAEDQTRRSLEAVNTTLSDVMARLGSLEGRPAAAVPPANEAPRPAEPVRVPPPAVARRSRPVVEDAAPPSLAEADEPLPAAPRDEVLLEPGSGRPTADASAAPDIRSSFIAAARRAAQTAAVEMDRQPSPTARTGPSFRSSMSPSEITRRVRRLIDEKRRPLLLAAAALILTLGTVQFARTTFESSAPVIVAAAPAAKPAAPQPTAPAPVSAPIVAQALPARAEAAPVAAAPKPAPPPVTVAAADPVTTSSVTPAPPRPASAPDKDATRAPEPGLMPVLAAMGQPSRAPEQPPPPALPAGIREAAAAGNASAMYELGVRTADGRGVPRDVKAAAGLFEKAAQKGLAPAQYRLANSFERGIGNVRDLDQAKTWYRRAAESGNVRAMHNLAVLLADGSSGKADYEGAVGWFTKAAEHGVRDSQFNLAVLFARGLGTGQDLVRAYHWLGVAAQAGDEDAAKKRDEVGARLAGADLARAKAGLERWRATPPSTAANEVSVPANGWAEGIARRAKEARV